jgi:hypothetical protein
MRRKVTASAWRLAVLVVPLLVCSGCGSPSTISAANTSGLSARTEEISAYSESPVVYGTIA